MRWLGMLPHVRVLLGILQGSRAFGGPVQVALNLTNRCNIRCIHCYFYSPLIENPNLFDVRRARRQGLCPPESQRLRHLQMLDADTGLTQAVIDDAISMGTRRLQFGGNGEPFMHPKALDLMARAKRGGSHCIAYTNGVLLDRATVDELVRMGFDDLRVTAMAGTGETYVRTHPGSTDRTFRDLRRRLLYLRERRDALGADRPKVRLACVVVAENCDGLVDFAHFAAELRADMVEFRPFDDLGDPGFASLVPTRRQAIHVRNQLMHVRDYLDSHGIRHNISFFLKVFNRKLDTALLYESIPCYYGWCVARVDLDGMVYPCCRCYRPLGNAYEDGLRRVWHGEAYRRFRREARALRGRGASVGGCECTRCVHHTANLRIHRALHPVRWQEAQLEQSDGPIRSRIQQ